MRGKGLGGSSAVNGQIAIRGLPGDYDQWAELTGDASWSYKEVLPYLRKLENDLRFGSNTSEHGTHGPIPIYRAPLARCLLEATALRESVWGRWGAVDVVHRSAALANGFKWVEDHNSGDAASGVSPYAINNFHDVRVSTNDAYLTPDTKARKNLQIVSGVLVDRVLFESNRAVGVVSSTGERFSGKEVILSAGAVMSPAVLIRSGIGPQKVLAKLGVPAVVLNEVC